MGKFNGVKNVSLKWLGQMGFLIETDTAGIKE